MAKINREQAETEVTAWIDKKKVYAETREKYQQYIDIMIEALANGDIVIDQDTFEIKHTLLFQIGEQEDTAQKALKYVPRINDKKIQPHMRGVKSDDADARLNALIAAITNTSKADISLLDTADKRIATAIGIFFM